MLPLGLINLWVWGPSPANVLIIVCDAAVLGFIISWFVALWLASATEQK